MGLKVRGWPMGTGYHSMSGIYLRVRAPSVLRLRILHATVSTTLSTTECSMADDCLMISSPITVGTVNVPLARMAWFGRMA